MEFSFFIMRYKVMTILIFLQCIFNSVIFLLNFKILFAFFQLTDPSFSPELSNQAKTAKKWRENRMTADAAGQVMVDVYHL